MTENKTKTTRRQKSKVVTPLPDVEERGKRMLDSLPPLARTQTCIFDWNEARAYSCYAGVTSPECGDPRAPKILRVIPEGQLFPDEGDPVIPPLGESAHDMLRAYILNEYYPCIGARAAFAKGTYRFGYYKHLAHLSSAAAMGRDLRRFVREFVSLGDFTSFVAVFKHPQTTSEDEFESLLWKHLQILHDNDSSEWDAHYDASTDSANFAFSFFGTAFFVVGMHANSSRFARRFGFTTLVFNPESQIRRLREEGSLGHFADTIRRRDTLYQGSINPSLPGQSDTTGGEARVYSGKAHLEGEAWKCPFQAHRELVKK